MGYAQALAGIIERGACALATIRFCFNRWARTRNIAAQGWPTPHCDADGDAVAGEEEGT